MAAQAPTAPLPGKDSELRVSEFQGVKALPAQLYIVNYVDGNGKDETRFAIVYGKTVRFLDDKAYTPESQMWLRDKILVAIGRADPNAPAPDESRKVLATPIPTDAGEEQL